MFEKLVCFKDRDKKVSDLTLGELEDFVYSVLNCVIQSERITNNNFYSAPQQVYQIPNPNKSFAVYCDTIDNSPEM